MEIACIITWILAVTFIPELSCTQVPAPTNIAFTHIGETSISLTIDGIANISQYEINVRGVYELDQSGGIITLANGPTTSRLLIDQITGLKSNRLYSIRIAGIQDGVPGNSTHILARTAPSGPNLHLAQVLPTVVSVFVEETPGASLCEVSYAKVGDESGRKTFRSESACRIATIRRLEANTRYSIRARVVTCGEIDYADSSFGTELNVTTAKLSIFGRVNYNVAYDNDLDEPSSRAYHATKVKLEDFLLRYYKNMDGDTTEVRVLQFESINSGMSTVVHHEILIASSTLPESFEKYSFSSAAGTYSLAGIEAQVAENSYSLSRNDAEYESNFEKSLPCTAHDVRKFTVVDSSTRESQDVELQGLSLVTNLAFEITEKEITKSGKTLHSFKNNSANVISQNYLLRTCPAGSRDLYYTRYYESLAHQTSPALRDIFIHSTGPTATPEVRSAGIEYGHASVVTFKRVPNAIRYVVSSGDINATMKPYLIDSSDEYWVRLSPLTPSGNIAAKLTVVTMPYDIPHSIDAHPNISTLPLAPTSVSWPYRDRHSLTLEWARSSAALGYFVRVLHERSFELLQDFHTEEPYADIHGLTPGRRYLVQLIPYNDAGNATYSANSEYHLFTDQDPPLLSIHPVNVSDSHVTVQWTGGVGADNIAVHVYNQSGLLKEANRMGSPTSITGLLPESEYNVSVIATFETGISQSPLISFRTDPLPPVLSTTAVNITDTMIAVEWTGGERATYVDMRISNTTTALFTILDVTSPCGVTGLRPNTTYVITVLTIYGRKLFESNNATFTTDPASSTTPCPTTVNLTVTEAPIDAVSPHPIAKNYTEKPVTSDDSLVNRPTDDGPNRNGDNTNDRKRNDGINMNIKLPSDSNEKNSTSDAPLTNLNVSGSISTSQEADVDAQNSSAENADIGGWAWMSIGAVVAAVSAIAVVGVFVISRVVIPRLMNSRNPVDSTDNVNNSEGGKASNGCRSTSEALKMDTIKDPDS